MNNANMPFKLMQNVTPKMLFADYWISMCRNAEHVRMNYWQIEQFNNCNIQKPDGEHILYDLAGFVNAYCYGVCVKRSIIWDTPEFNNLLTAIYVNEPVVVLDENAECYKICCVYYQGWIAKESIALCPDYYKWLALQNPKKFVVVLADYINLPNRIADTEPEMQVSGLRLDMGVKLELSDEECYEGMYYNYMVKIPVRDKRGELKYAVTGIPVSMDVNIGYMSYSGANVLRQAFKTLGNVYGWAGTLNSRDCSALVMDIHRCFGLILPRDVSGQMRINSCRTLEFDDRVYNKGNHAERTIGSDRTEQKCRRYHKLCDLSVGDILGFPGHTCVYVGFDYNNCTHYVISEMGSLYTFSEGEAKRVVVNSCVLSDLFLKRENHMTWEQSLTYAKILGN